MEDLILMCVHGCLCGYITKKNGSNFWIGFILGAALGIVAIPIAYAIKNKNLNIKVNNKDSKGDNVLKEEIIDETKANIPIQEYNDEESPIKESKSNPIFDFISVILIISVLVLSFYSVKHKFDNKPILSTDETDYTSIIYDNTTNTEKTRMNEIILNSVIE